jgi:hypothetical protein
MQIADVNSVSESLEAATAVSAANVKWAAFPNQSKE